MKQDIYSIDGIHTCPELMECVKQVGFLPLLESGIQGFAAELHPEHYLDVKALTSVYSK